MLNRVNPRCAVAVVAFVVIIGIRENMTRGIPRERLRGSPVPRAEKGRRRAEGRGQAQAVLGRHQGATHR